MALKLACMDLATAEPTYGNDLIAGVTGEGIRQCWMSSVGDTPAFHWEGKKKQERGNWHLWKLGGGIWQVRNRGGEGIWPLWRKGGKGALTCLRGERRKYWHFLAVTEKEVLTLRLITSNCLGGVCRRQLVYCAGLEYGIESVLFRVESGKALNSVPEDFLPNKYCNTALSFIKYNRLCAALHHT